MMSTVSDAAVTPPHTLARRRMTIHKDRVDPQDAEATALVERGRKHRAEQLANRPAGIFIWHYAMYVFSVLALVILLVSV